jgi:hypothetical protein
MTWGISILTAVIAVAGAWIGWQQLQLNRTKLQHDLYDKRFRVYEAARGLLSHVFREGQPSIEEMNKYWLGTSDAVFLFDEDMDKYLDGVSKRIFGMHTNHTMLSAAKDQTARERLSQKMMDDMEWLRTEYSVMREKFRPFLQLPQIRAFPWQ